MCISIIFMVHVLVMLLFPGMLDSDRDGLVAPAGVVVVDGTVIVVLVVVVLVVVVLVADSDGARPM